MRCYTPDTKYKSMSRDLVRLLEDEVLNNKKNRMKEYTVRSIGRNQYEVTRGDDVETVDLDGFTVVSIEDFALLEAAGLDSDAFITPEHSGGDKFWQAAAEYATDNSGFDMDEYISEN